MGVNVASKAVTGTGIDLPDAFAHSEYYGSRGGRPRLRCRRRRIGSAWRSLSIAGVRTDRDFAIVRTNVHRCSIVPRANLRLRGPAHLRSWGFPRTAEAAITPAASAGSNTTPAQPHNVRSAKATADSGTKLPLLSLAAIFCLQLLTQSRLPLSRNFGYTVEAHGCKVGIRRRCRHAQATALGGCPT